MRRPKESLEINLNKDALINIDYRLDANGKRVEALPLGGAPVKSGSVEVLFDGIEDRILREIEKADAVFGVVAWLTNQALLRALRAKKSSFVVQKEDFLRPCKGEPAWHSTLRTLYSGRSGMSRFETPAHNLTTSGGDEIERTRCAGLAGGRRDSGIPRIHHKFAVFARAEPRRMGRGEFCHYEPYTVVTGSFNWTQNANRSRENLVIIHDPEISEGYWEEWARVIAISEPLNWEHSWIEPEWRIGT